ncbi:hypothetical protein J6590_068966 [Homalodisca vitripennis]|nr:hypothetical protein J6590_068966 [Homalodisca vitripennis]
MKINTEKKCNHCCRWKNHMRVNYPHYALVEYLSLVVGFFASTEHLGMHISGIIYIRNLLNLDCTASTEQMTSISSAIFIQQYPHPWHICWHRTVGHPSALDYLSEASSFSDALPVRKIWKICPQFLIIGCTTDTEQWDIHQRWIIYPKSPRSLMLCRYGTVGHLSPVKYVPVISSSSAALLAHHIISSSSAALLARYSCITITGEVCISNLLYVSVISSSSAALLARYSCITITVEVCISNLLYVSVISSSSAALLARYSCITITVEVCISNLLYVSVISSSSAALLARYSCITITVEVCISNLFVLGCPAGTLQLYNHYR